MKEVNTSIAKKLTDLEETFNKSLKYFCGEPDESSEEITTTFMKFKKDCQKWRTVYDRELKAEKKLAKKAAKTTKKKKKGGDGKSVGFSSGLLSGRNIKK